MVYTGAEFSQEELFEELVEKARYEKVKNYDEYKAIIDDVIEEKKTYGFIGDEEDYEQLRDTLQMRWSEIQARLAE